MDHNGQQHVQKSAEDLAALISTRYDYRGSDAHLREDLAVMEELKRKGPGDLTRECHRE